MSARFASPDPQLNEPGGNTRSNFSTERSPKTALLFAAKEVVLLPTIAAENGQPETRGKSSGGSERLVQE